MASLRGRISASPCPSGARAGVAPPTPTPAPPRPRALLGELRGAREMLLPGGRALSFREFSKIDDHLTLDAKNRGLQRGGVGADQRRGANPTPRLQAEMDENPRLR